MRASMVYTPTPSQLKKVNDPRERKMVSTKKRMDLAQDRAAADVSILSSRSAEGHLKEKHDLTTLKQQVDDLQKKLLEKEEALRLANDSVNRMIAAYASVDELTQLLAEESMIKLANSQIHNTKIMLADKGAAMEKLQWEVKTSNRKVKELQDDIVSMDMEVTALMQIFQEMSNKDSVAYRDHEIAYFDNFDLHPPIEKFDDIDIMKIEEATTYYLDALALAKEDPSNDFIAAARQRLQAFAF